MSSAELGLRVEGTWNGDPVEAAEQGEGRLRWEDGGLVVEVAAPFHGDPAPSGPPGPTPGLWEYEVVELFVAHGERYTELELGPHGHHLLLRLDGARRVVASGLPVDYSARVAGSRWTGRARVAAEHLPPEPWTGNAYAIHGVGHTRRYLAAYPVWGEAPDFHRLEHFRPLERPAD